MPVIDAFAVLKQSAKRSTPSSVSKGQPLRKKAKSTISPGVGFDNCPVCGKTFARALLASHVNECLENNSAAENSHTLLQEDSLWSRPLDCPVDSHQRQAEPCPLAIAQGTGRRPSSLDGATPRRTEAFGQNTVCNTLPQCEPLGCDDPKDSACSAPLPSVLCSAQTRTDVGGGAFDGGTARHPVSSGSHKMAVPLGQQDPSWPQGEAESVTCCSQSRDRGRTSSNRPHNTDDGSPSLPDVFRHGQSLVGERDVGPSAGQAEEPRSSGLAAANAQQSGSKAGASAPLESRSKLGASVGQGAKPQPNAFARLMRRERENMQASANLSPCTPAREAAAECIPATPQGGSGPPSTGSPTSGRGPRSDGATPAATEEVCKGKGDVPIPSKDPGPIRRPCDSHGGANLRAVAGIGHSHGTPLSADMSIDTEGTEQEMREECPSAAPNLLVGKRGRAAAKAGKNAFAMLMNTQRERSRVTSFYLERTPEGRWAWHWWSELPGGTPATGSQPASRAAQVAAVMQPHHGPAAPCVAPHSWSTTVQVAAKNLGAGPKAASRKISVRLLTNVGPGVAGEMGWDARDLASNTAGPDGPFRGGPSLLKSALQKNVRLCLVDQAVRCAMHLLKSDPGEFLRRFTIIVLEDCLLHPALPMLVWLMMAHAKGFALGRTHVAACLGVVRQVAAMPIRDSLPSCPPHIDPVAMLDGAFDDEVGGEAAVLVKCMLVRAAFGGMACDVDMLRRFATLWQGRFAGTQGAPPQAPSSRCFVFTAEPHAGSGQHLGEAGHASWLHFVKATAANANSKSSFDGSELARVGPLQRGDIPLSAVDFHVSDIVQDLLKQPLVERASELAAERFHCRTGAPLDLADRLKQAMWLFRSSTNRRPTLTQSTAEEDPGTDGKELEELWRIALGPADAYSSRHVASRFRL